ncbi:leucyl aminopeptidase [Sphingomonas zeicaulis]|uniref:leucyl aminopeptidase family protein n=1 Tax=Sphingomonas zeicaulis TaxID=1632740 RepID=UPI003D1EA832
MTDFSASLQPDRGQSAVSIALVDKAGFEGWLRLQPPRTRAAVAAQKFKGEAQAMAILPGEKPEEWSVVAGVTDVQSLGTWCLAKAAGQLPEGVYRLESGDPGAATLGWLLAHYSFDRYRSAEAAAAPRTLLSRDAARIDETVRIAGAVGQVRDMVNVPAADMGPAQLQAEVEALARDFGTKAVVTGGKALAEQFPMVHAVGRAADPARAPRMLELVWGRPEHPRVAIVGKGVCFDSGGLDIKPSSGMRLMKKDMGGAAHAIALARLVMAARLPVRLHLLVPAVENAIAGDAFRPGDILRSRKGLSVEIGNTDAEGRLILADALTRAVEESPALVIDFATLTGAARVALGPDLPALFSNDDALAAGLLAAGSAVDDPLWQLPLWSGYDEMLKSDIADLNNAPEGGFAGAVTAALFLRRFVPETVQWAHLDTFAWRPAAKPGRPRGGEALGLRAAWRSLSQRFPAQASS